MTTGERGMYDRCGYCAALRCQHAMSSHTFVEPATAPTAPDALREAATALLAAWDNGPTDGPPMYRAIAALRRSLAPSTPPRG